MKKMRSPTRWGTALAVALLFLCIVPAASLGGVVGSRHDFTGSPVRAKGVCSACHIAHGAQYPLLWPKERPLGPEMSYFTPNADPDYVPGSTLLCYDCHDDNQTVPDRDPPAAVWSAGAAPQDIAFSASTTSADFLRWKTTVGYYELADGASPKTGAVPKSTDNPLTATGGHYWKSAPSGTPAYQRADKIACGLCHDPHESRNDVFFRTETPDGNGGTVTLGTGLKASANSRNHAVGGSGREMCAACHTYSDAGTPVTLWNRVLPKPPLSVDEHLAASAAPCTDCHKHNRITASCENCHGLDGVVDHGKDGVPGTADDAPNVMTVQVGATWVSVWDGSWWRQVVGDGGDVQQGGHGDPRGKKGALPCTGCHDTSLPAGTHLDGIVNKVGDPGFSTDLAVSVLPANTNENTAHLKAEFINASAGGAAIQVNFDAACAACHLVMGVKPHSHYSQDDPPETDVKFGTRLTVSDGSLITPHLPLDIDLSTLAPAGPPHYAPCVACHNPHGSVNTEKKSEPASLPKNFMLRFRSFKSAHLCNICHR